MPKQLPVRLNIALDIEPICPYERDAGIVVLVNSKVVGEWPLKSPARQVLELETVPEYPDLLSLEFWNKGLKPATELRDWPHPWPQPWFDARLPNFRLHALSITDPASQAVARNVVRADGSVVSFDYEDQTFTFFIDQLDDSVEIFPSLGRFYEVHELELLRSHVPQGASILDVGAHVGNHTVYFARVMKAKRVVAIEPSSHAGFLLRTNCALNHLTNVDLSHLGKALGDDSGFGSLLRADPYNSGGTRLRSGGGPVPIVRGDDLFKGERFDLIKIDVEGMELRVLSGLAETIARSRPRIFVEVIDDNRQDFQVFIDGHDYQVTWEGQMYPGISNILLEPKKDSACPS